MKKPSSHITFLFLLLFAVLLREGLILNMSSFGTTNENAWYKQYPFCLDDSSNLSEISSRLAYNGNYVELVISFSLKENLNQELASIGIPRDGYVKNQLFLANETRAVVISIPTNEVSAFLKNVANNKNVKYVEPNWKFYIDALPNDPGWINQWGLDKIEADTAWDTQKGNDTILVAVVDTGIYYSHSDLAENYVALGYDWVNEDSDPMDDHGHGTHCAGIIAATLNNSDGIAGIAQVRIMAEKGFSRIGMGYDDDLANAIIHAVNQGAKIISCSWGSYQNSQLIHDAVEYATNMGALVIAAAGNSGTDTRHYPAAYSEVVAVAATDENDNPALFTAYGDWIDLAAPGTSIYSTYLRNIYISMSGTSMACPHVAGVAALIWSQFPTMTNEQVYSQLVYTADDLGSKGFDIYYGYGRVNARKALVQSIALVGSKILRAPSNNVYFLYKDPKESTAVETAYDGIASGIIYGLTTNQQRQIFSSGNELFESGEIDTSVIFNSTVIVLGGPCPQKIVGYYEDVGLTPLRFSADDTCYKFLTQDNTTVAVLSKTAADSGHEDIFVLEVFANKSNLIVILYGTTWKGTWAGGIYLKEIISKNLNGYAEKCYVFHWIDGSEKNGIPESSEIHQEYPAP